MLKVHGKDTIDGFKVNMTSADERPSDENLHNTAMQCIRGRSKMLLDAGFLFLDYGKLDENRLL